MPLIGNYINVKNVDELVKDQLEHAKLHYFCFAMMAIEIAEITEENLGDVWVRLDFVQNRYGGGWFTADGVSYDYKMEDIVKYIGYKTNCSDRTQWTFFMDKAKYFAQEYQEKMLELHRQELLEQPAPTPKPKRRKAAQVVA